MGSQRLQSAWKWEFKSRINTLTSNISITNEEGCSSGLWQSSLIIPDRWWWGNCIFFMVIIKYSTSAGLDNQSRIINHARTCSVSRALDCRAVGRGFNSWVLRVLQLLRNKGAVFALHVFGHWQMLLSSLQWWMHILIVCNSCKISYNQGCQKVLK